MLIAGGLSALQTMTIVTALPFAIIMIIAMLGMWRALVIEGHRDISLLHHMQVSRYSDNSLAANWKKRLASIVNFPDRAAVEGFIHNTAMPAMQRLSQALVAQGWPAEAALDADNGRAYLQISKPDQLDFVYEIRLREYLRPDFAYPEMRRTDDDAQQHYYRAEVFLRRGGQTYDVYGYDEQEIIGDILDHFEKYLHFLHISPGVLPWNMAEHDEMLQQPPT
ncbi:MAG: hypothetical protein CMK85_09355 [Pseudomonadales bacterium]|nr:hypothetical protein [Pseudomonadales bacterium]